MDTKKFITRNSITIKALVVGILILLMLIPISMVKDLITEREAVQDVVKKDITKRWGGEQTVTGPILVIPYKNDDSSVGYAYFLPEAYSVNGTILPEKKKDGILEVLCYQSDLKINAKFKYPDYEQLNLSENKVSLNDAFLIVGISDVNGIKNQIKITSGGANLEVSAGIKNIDFFKSGFTIQYPIQEDQLNKNFNIDINLSIGGTERLYITPVGKNTIVNLKSDFKPAKYTYPQILPSVENESNGFDAQWNLFDYNQNYTPMWIGQNPDIVKNNVGVDLLLPVDHYQKNIRSIKYAILFIALTFVVFFIIELTNKKPIHPVQYLLVSFALVLFYSLLLAFSEYIGFNWAYLISAMAIITLLSAYSHSIFKSLKRTGFMCVFLSALYAFLYIIIQEEEKSLLFGNIGLFVVLAIIMYASRKINWYKDDSKTINAK